MIGRIESGQLCTVIPIDPIALEVREIVLCKIAGNEHLQIVKAISASGPWVCRWWRSFLMNGQSRYHPRKSTRKSLMIELKPIPDSRNAPGDIIGNSKFRAGIPKMGDYARPATT
jgi:hypothetical protein